jgi:hypothetical protein
MIQAYSPRRLATFRSRKRSSVLGPVGTGRPARGGRDSRARRILATSANARDPAPAIPVFSRLLESQRLSCVPFAPRVRRLRIGNTASSCGRPSHGCREVGSPDWRHHSSKRSPRGAHRRGERQRPWRRAEACPVDRRGNPPGRLRRARRGVGGFVGGPSAREPIGRFTPSVLVVSWASVAKAANCECPLLGLPAGAQGR